MANFNRYDIIKFDDIANAIDQLSVVNKYSVVLHCAPKYLRPNGVKR